MVVEKGRKSVNTYVESRNTSYNNRVSFKLCEDEDCPLISKFKVGLNEYYFLFFFIPLYLW